MTGDLTDFQAEKAELRVLVVDDSEIIRNAITNWLESTGKYRVVATAQDGIEAIEAFSRESPDIVTLDISMPQMDGLEALKKLQEINSKAAIIIISALSARKTALEAMNLGAASYLNKPFTKPELLEVLEEVTG